MDKSPYKETALDWATSKSKGEMKANFEGYEKPYAYSSQSSDKEVCPDITFENRRGGKSITEIALKVEDVQPLVTRWKLLGTMADMKRGNLYLLAPRGHKMFTKRLVDQYGINAQIVSI